MWETSCRWGERQKKMLLAVTAISQSSVVSHKTPFVRDHTAHGVHCLNAWVLSPPRMGVVAQLPPVDKGELHNQRQHEAVVRNLDEKLVK